MDKNVLLRKEVEDRGNIVKYNDGFHSSMIKFLSKATTKYYFGDSCLVLGPSEGVELEKQLLSHFKSITFVDGSSKVIQEVKNKIPGQEYIVSLFEELDLKHKYNTIILHHILEHLDNPPSLLVKLKDYCTEETVIIVSVPNANSIHRILGVKMNLLNDVHNLNESDLKVGHKRVYDFQLFEKEILSAGLKVIDKKGVFFKPLSNSEMEKLTNEQIEGFFRLGNEFQEYCAEILFICSIQ